MIKKYYFQLLSEIIENKKYFIFCLFISIYVFLAQLFVATSKKEILITIITLLVLFLISILSRIVFSVASILILMITSIILHLNLHWGASSLASRLQAALLSPSYEMKEYLITYFNSTDFFILLYVLVGFYFIYTFLSNFKSSFKMVKVSSAFLLSIFVLIVGFTNQIQKVPPYSYIPKLLQANEYKKSLDKRRAYLNSLEKKESTLSDNIINYDKIVIVIGESVNKYHMGVYGYKKPTTPFLSNLVKQKNGFLFLNVIAPTNQTRHSIPIALTSASVNNFDKFFSSESIISKFREFGYKTYWLSNQYIAGMADSYIASIARETDISKTMNFAYPPGGKEDTEFDMILVKYLNKFKKQQVKKEVYFIHLLGSHFQYKKRYPEGTGLISVPKNKVDEYDNSIHYTDKVLNELYKVFNNEKLLFVYISDHAEMVHIDKSGHGYIPPFQNEYDIPLIIYSSEYNERITKIKVKNDKVVFNAESFNHIIQYVTGIEETDSKISNSTEVISLDPKKVVDYNSLTPHF